MNEITNNPLELDPERFVLGETKEEVYLDSPELNRLAAQRLLDQTTRRYYILSRDLDPNVFSTRDFSESMARLCRRGRHTDVRMLIADNRKLIHQTHRLLDTIRQFSSYIQLRVLPRRFAHLEQSYILVDDSGVLIRQHGELYNATVSFHDPNQFKELHEDFMGLWERSDPDPDVRQLSY
jgi:hypothetical protein